MKRTYETLGSETGALVDRKNQAYGSSFMKSGEFLRLLWPDGVPANRLDDALLLVRIFDKQMRIAVDQDAFGESPYADIAGYGLLGAKQHEDRKAGQERKNECASANMDAVEGSTEQNGSADPSVRKRITASANVKRENRSKRPSILRSLSTSASMDAPALNAPAPASRVADVRARAQVRRWRRKSRNLLIFTAITTAFYLGCLSLIFLHRGGMR